MLEAEKNKKSGSEILGFIVIHLKKMYFDVHNFDELLLFFLKKGREWYGNKWERNKDEGKRQEKQGQWCNKCGITKVQKEKVKGKG